MDTSRSLRIGIQKSGRLTQKTIELLTGIGLRFDEYKDRLLVKARNFDVELLLIRDDDIPEYVQDGVCDLGFVGANTTSEKNAKVSVVRNLDYGLCRLAVAVPKDSEFKTAADLDGKRIATSYPRLTKEWFLSRGTSVEVVEISGSVEIAPSLNVADAVCDLVSTGNTLKANGLVELETIFRSECQLIRTNKPIDAAKELLILKFLQRIDGRQKAERSRYIMMNAPRASLERISALLPALSSPTILPLADQSMIAIHTVIPETKFWEVMENLKDAGATGIVMLPIETMIV